MVIRIGFGVVDFFARQLTREDRIEALDSLGGIPVRNGFDLERVQFTELGDLIEGQRGILNEPNGGCLRHQRRLGHGQIPFVLRPPERAKPSVITDDGSAARTIGIPIRSVQ